jgi:hypothetical protein
MVKEVVSGMGANSSRTDKNPSSRAKKIQRDAKIGSASGGSYGSRAENESLQSAQPTTATGSAVSQNAYPEMSKQLPNIFSPGNPDVPFTDGAGMDTAGRTPRDLVTPNLSSPDPGLVLISAMYAASPTPILRRMLEAYDQEGIY